MFQRHQLDRRVTAPGAEQFALQRRAQPDAVIAPVHFRVGGEQAGLHFLQALQHILSGGVLLQVLSNAQRVQRRNQVFMKCAGWRGAALPVQLAQRLADGLQLLQALLDLLVMFAAPVQFFLQSLFALLQLRAVAIQVAEHVFVFDDVFFKAVNALQVAVFIVGQLDEARFQQVEEGLVVEVLFDAFQPALQHGGGAGGGQRPAGDVLQRDMRALQQGAQPARNAAVFTDDADVVSAGQ